MDLSSTTNAVEIGRPPLLSKVYNLTTYITSLVILRCYQNPKLTFLTGMVISYITLSALLDATIRAFFTTPVHRLPLAVALILVAIVWYLHRLIKEYDESALREAVRAAGAAAIEQTRIRDGEGDDGTESETSSEVGEDGHTGGTRRRARTGGLDLDVWQGGERIKRKGWTPSEALAVV